MTENNWQRIWEKERPAQGDESPLARLLRADGYDTLAPIQPADWIDYVQRVADRLGLVQGDSVYDVGCGAGALLWPLQERGYVCGGLDYSATQIALATKTMPQLTDLTCAEASQLPTLPVYDSVVACATFLYFTNLAYAEKVARLMIEKAGRSLAVLDLPDLSKKADILRWRMAAVGEEEYRRRYDRLDHLYFSKDWFAQLFHDAGLSCAIEDQTLAGYGHRPFRFNVFAWKSDRPAEARLRDETGN